MKLLADASLPDLTTCFPAPFVVSRYDTHADLQRLLPEQDVLLCRSTLRVDQALLQGSQLRCVATASSGTDHIDARYLAAQGIELFDARGSNAPSVADYVLSSLAHLRRRTDFHGNRAMVIGMGAVGSLVARRLRALGWAVSAHDPLRTDGFQSDPLTNLAQYDLLCVHPDLHDKPPFPSRRLLNEALLTQLRPGAAIINAARGDIVDEDALLRLKPDIYYCVDVFRGEPDICADTIAFATLCTPHIAGHSLEAKTEAVRMASEKLHTYFQLPCPPRPAVPRLTPPTAPSQDWEDVVLAMYDPLAETQALKAASDKREAFLRLRTAHRVRHDFDCYSGFFQGVLHQTGDDLVI